MNEDSGFWCALVGGNILRSIGRVTAALLLILALALSSLVGMWVARTGMKAIVTEERKEEKEVPIRCLHRCLAEDNSSPANLMMVYQQTLTININVIIVERKEQTPRVMFPPHPAANVTEGPI